MADTTIIYRKDYLPPSHKVYDISLDVQLYDDRAEILSRLTIEANGGADEIVLNGEGLVLLDVHVNDELRDASDYHYEDGLLTISRIPEKCVLSIRSSCNPYENTALEGLYNSQGMLCTQCEPEGFRRICFYLDRPDVLAPFNVRIEADRKYPQLLSNGNLIETGMADGDRHFAVWQDPHPKPSYLFALVAGDLELVKDKFETSSGRMVDLHIYVEHGNGHLTAHAMDSLKRSMKWDEDVYGLEYDLDLFQIVAVSHFNMGAMENKGLNIFNSKFVLADSRTATDDDLDRVEAIIAHEYFHNWTGNRVTCRDWFQLTLKEGLTVFRDQCFSADMHDKGVRRTDDVSTLRAIQFPEDSSPTAHPIRPDSFVEINNFYTPTVYEKGAEVIRMFHSQLGADGFRKGMDLYFARHDGQAVTCDDFISAMADANHVDFSAMHAWYEQAGTPKLHISRQVEDAKTTLHLTQELSATKAGTSLAPLPLPVRLGFLSSDGMPASFTLDGDDYQTESLFVMTDHKAEVAVTFKEPSKGPFIPSLLRDFSAPVRLIDDVSSDERMHLMAHDSDLFNRWDSGQKLLEQAIHDYLKGSLQNDFIDRLSHAFSMLLDDKTVRDDFKAQMMSLPGQAVIESAIKNCDPVAVFQARRIVCQKLALPMLDKMLGILSDKKLPMTEQASQRHLRNALLSWAIETGAKEAKIIALKQSEDNNMSLAQGALSALKNFDCDERDKAMTMFHDKWLDDSLVMEKWFALSASAPVNGTISRIEELMSHPAFDENSPNKIRSVLGAFCAMNPTQFHAEDGSGYEFIASQLIALDKRNPQIAARMVLGLTRMSAYDTARQSRMKSSLHDIYKHATSRDLKEVVGKALAN